MRTRRFLVILISVAVLIVGAKLFLGTIYVPPIIMYHSLDENEEVTKLSLSTSGFARQMEFLDKHNYNVISLEEMVGLIKEKKRIPSKTITITFDDGYRNNYLCAYPILKKHDFPATLFVITDFIGKKGYMTTSDLKELTENNITIASHTKSHQWLPSLNDANLKEELVVSKAVLEKITSQEVKFISYPVGAHDERVKSRVKDAGYEAACATNPGPGKDWRDIYALKRIRISRTSNNLFVFWIETSGYYTFIKEKRDEE